jgi:Mg2+-importing ATPase
MSITPKAPTPALPDGLTAVRFAAAPVDEVLGWLDSSEQGLSSAEVSARRARYGPNAVRTHHVNALAVLGRQLRSAVLILLAATAVVSYFLGDSLQAIIIGVILAASIGLGFINEYRAERAAAALHSGVRHTAVARRDGTFVAIDVTELVPGDVIRLSLGEAVPADLRLIEATGLECNESILTGESMSSEKSPQPVPADAELAESSDLAFMGTIVSAGEGTGVVYATGRNAEFGRIAAGLGERQPETDFQVGLRKFSYLLLQVAIALTVLILVSNLLLRKPVIDSVLFSLAIAVGITPQLLPAVVSASLATGSRKLAKAKVLVKRLVCIEDLGDIDTSVWSMGSARPVRTATRCCDSACWPPTSTPTRAVSAPMRWTPRSGNPLGRRTWWVLACNGWRVRRSTTSAAPHRSWSTTTGNASWCSRVHPSRCWPDAKAPRRPRSTPWTRCSPPAGEWSR